MHVLLAFITPTKNEKKIHAHISKIMDTEKKNYNDFIDKMVESEDVTSDEDSYGLGDWNYWTYGGYWNGILKGAIQLHAPVIDRAIFEVLEMEPEFDLGDKEPDPTLRDGNCMGYHAEQKYAPHGTLYVNCETVDKSYRDISVRYLVTPEGESKDIDFRKSDSMEKDFWPLAEKYAKENKDARIVLVDMFVSRAC